MGKPSNQTNKNTPINRGKKSNNDIESELRSLWLRFEDYAQTQPEAIVNDLLQRFKDIKSVLFTFRNFTFTPREPTKALIL